MVQNPLLVAALSAGLLAPLASGMYAKNSPVLQLDHKNFEQKIMQSGHASIVEFYAPWCGHCKNLKPAYEAAAGNLKGLANVAAIDCDEEKNKPTCGKYGIQGFPTLKSFKPGKTPGKPVIEDYNGPRTAKGIVDWTLDRIPNHIARVNSKTVEEFLSNGNDTVKSILFTTKGVATPLYKALAVDFFGAITFAQVRDKESEVTSLFGVAKFPTLLVLPGGNADGVVYDGEMKKDAMHKFLSGFAESTEGKAPPKADKKKKKQESSSVEPESSSSTTTPAPPKDTFDATIQNVPSADFLMTTCLKKTCVMVITPTSPKSLEACEQANAYIHHIKPDLFPFYQLPFTALAPKFKEFAMIEDIVDIQIRAINVKKGWWAAYKGNTESHDELKNWLDAIRMGEVTKNKFPAFEFEERIETNPPEGDQAPVMDLPPEQAEQAQEKPQEPVGEPPVKEAPKHEEL